MMMWRKILSIGLACGLLLAPLSASPLPSSSSSSVTLSAEEYAAIEAAMMQAQEALKQSNATIAKQSKDLTTLWIFCGVLGTALILDATAELITAVKK
jgi:hypothetical protein